MLDILTSPSEVWGEPPFATKQKALMFAAALGWSRGVRRTLEDRGGEIRLDVFEAASDECFVEAFAVRDLARQTDSGHEADSVSIFEEYAAGGLKLLDDRLSESGGDVFDSLLALALDDLERGDGYSSG